MEYRVTFENLSNPLYRVHWSDCRTPRDALDLAMTALEHQIGPYDANALYGSVRPVKDKKMRLGWTFKVEGSDFKLSPMRKDWEVEK
jgi:hypothetical protein